MGTQGTIFQVTTRWPPESSHSQLVRRSVKKAQDARALSTSRVGAVKFGCDLTAFRRLKRRVALPVCDWEPLSPPQLCMHLSQWMAATTGPVAVQIPKTTLLVIIQRTQVC